MVLSSTDLPVPEPPTTPSTSPRLDVQVEVVVDHAVAESRDQAAHLDGRGLRVQWRFVFDVRHMSSSM